MVVVTVTTSGLALLPVEVVVPQGMLVTDAFWICASAVSMPPSAVITETDRSRSRPVCLFSRMTIIVIVIIMAAARAVSAIATSRATPSSSPPRERPVSARNNMTSLLGSGRSGAAQPAGVAVVGVAPGESVADCGRCVAAAGVFRLEAHDEVAVAVGVDGALQCERRARR